MAHGLHPALWTHLLDLLICRPAVHGHLCPHIAQQLDISRSSIAGKHYPQRPLLASPVIRRQAVLHSKAEETQAASEDTT